MGKKWHLKSNVPKEEEATGNLAQKGAVFAMIGLTEDLARVRCDACSGYGHASSSCPTYARFVEFGAGNK